MKASELKDALTIEQVYTILEDLGADPKISDPYISSRTVCHNGENAGGKRKLDYNHDIKSFICYTGCGQTFNIFELVMKTKMIEFAEAAKYVREKAGIESFGGSLAIKYGFSPDNDEFYKKFVKKKERKDVKHNIYDFDNATIGTMTEPHFEFVNDGISPSVYIKRNLRFDLVRNQILIPHCDIDGNCVGIRARNLEEWRVKSGEKYIPYWRFGQSYKYDTRHHFYGLDHAKEAICRNRIAIIFESEKSPMQLESMHPDFNVGIATSGSSLSYEHIQLLLKLNVDEIVIAYDKEFHEIGDKKEQLYAKKIQKSIVNRLAHMFRVSVMWDLENDLDYKDSPTDKGVEVFDKLWKNRIALSYKDD